MLDAVRTRLWPVPAIGIALAILGGVLLPAIDGALDGRVPGLLSQFLFGGGPASARDVLSAIAASVMTVTSLTFSLTLVTLQLASGQYSPRLLRTFARDRFVQRTLALFVATFVYALTVLRSVRDGSSGAPVFVPQVSVTVAYLLALVSVIGLVLFLAHLVRQIRVETMLGIVLADAEQAADAMFGELDETARSALPPMPPDSAISIDASRTGFLVGVDEEALVAAAARVDAVVLVDRKPGEWTVAGTPVAVVWSADDGGALDGDALGQLRDCVAAAVRTGDERTPVEDVGYALRQLTDVVVKALSPGINDPTTAVHAIGHSSALLCMLAGRDLGATVHCDDDDVVRAVIPRPDFAELLDLAVAQPRRYGAGDAAVLSALLRLLRELAWRGGPSRRDAVVSQLARLRRTVDLQEFDDVERAGLERLALAVEEALGGTWRMPDLSRG
ncbi:DUF2254 domain-containing protein [Mycobacterium sp. Y57]|uniref:DUF2254 domain-containing protein n=1 Tax=Mycolicibacterium xanthum TaxID=2796469 RepID=UPI001C85514D|nr:DUF2254 domain-containing protein [Mycolicibacterium xanthum]